MNDGIFGNGRFQLMRATPNMIAEIIGIGYETSGDVGEAIRIARESFGWVFSDNDEIEIAAAFRKEFSE